MGEIKEYTFKMLRDKEIRTTQGKTGKFKMFFLPVKREHLKAFKRWLEAAGLEHRH